MLTITLTPDHLRDPSVNEAFTQLLGALSGNLPDTHEDIKAPKVPASIRNRSNKDLVLDSDIVETYGSLVKKQKSLYFMTLVKEAGEISSADMIEKMEEAFPYFAARSIGGITGALNRWLLDAGVERPYEHTKNEFGETIYKWVSAQPKTRRARRSRRG